MDITELIGRIMDISVKVKQLLQESPGSAVADLGAALSERICSVQATVQNVVQNMDTIELRRSEVLTALSIVEDSLSSCNKLLKNYNTKCIFVRILLATRLRADLQVAVALLADTEGSLLEVLIPSREHASQRPQDRTTPAPSLLDAGELPGQVLDATATAGVWAGVRVGGSNRNDQGRGAQSAAGESPQADQLPKTEMATDAPTATGSLSRVAVGAAPAAPAPAPRTQGGQQPSPRQVSPRTAPDTLNIPAAFKCPITLSLMRDPVMLVESGHTFERRAIEAHLARANTNPITNLPLRTRLLVVNRGLRGAIEEWLQENGLTADQADAMESGLDPAAAGRVGDGVGGLDAGLGSGGGEPRGGFAGSAILAGMPVLPFATAVGGSSTGPSSVSDADAEAQTRGGPLYAGASDVAGSTVIIGRWPAGGGITAMLAALGLAGRSWLAGSENMQPVLQGVPNINDTESGGGVLQRLMLGPAALMPQSKRVVVKKIPVLEAQEVMLRHGCEWSHRMAGMLGDLGILEGVNQDGLFLVRMDSSRSIVRWSPALVTAIGVGARVAIRQTSASAAQAAQHGHGGWTDEMESMLGECGVVKDVNATGDMLVDMDNGSGAARWNPLLVVLPDRINLLTVGRRVRIRRVPVEQAQAIQGGRWTDAMTRFLGMVGTVESVDGDGDLTVRVVDDRGLVFSHLWSRELVEPFSERPPSPRRSVLCVGKRVAIKRVSVQEARAAQVGHGGWASEMAAMLGKPGIVVRMSNEGAAYVEVDDGGPVKLWNASLLNVVEVGSKVVIKDIPLDAAKAAQEGHGGWVDAMSGLLGKTGVVEGFDDDMDVRVAMDDGSGILLWNPLLILPAAA